MALEQFRVQIAMLMDEISQGPRDPRELQEQVREKLAEMQALGLPLPEDLVDLEAYLDTSLIAPRPMTPRTEPPTAEG